MQNLWRPAKNKENGTFDGEYVQNVIYSNYFIHCRQPLGTRRRDSPTFCLFLYSSALVLIMVTDASLAYGLILMFFSSVLCSSAGVGGGSLNVPILYSIIGFDYDTATVLSLCTLMGNYLLQVLVNLDKRHPSSPTTPLIYWDAVLVMLPAELGGANLGVIVAKAMPKTIIFILAMTVLVIAVYFTGMKGKKLYHLENDLLEQEASVQKEEYEYDNEGALDNIQNNDVYLGNPIFDNKSGFVRNSTSPLLEEIQPPHHLLKRRSPKKIPIITIASIIPPYLCCYFACCPTNKRASSRTASNFRALNGSTDLASIETDSMAESVDEDLPPVVQPWNIIAVIIGVFVLYLACYVVQKEYDQCSMGNYISLACIYFLLVVQVGWGIRYLVVQKNEKALLAPSKRVAGEIHWGSKSTLVPVVSFLIGITSALLGIGGGELMGPMLLMLKV